MNQGKKYFLDCGGKASTRNSPFTSVGMYYEGRGQEGSIAPTAPEDAESFSKKTSNQNGRVYSTLSRAPLVQGCYPSIARRLLAGIAPVLLVQLRLLFTELAHILFGSMPKILPFLPFVDP